MKVLNIFLFVFLFFIKCAGTPPPLKTTSGTETPSTAGNVKEEVDTSDETGSKAEPANQPGHEEAGNPYEIYKDVKKMPTGVVGIRTSEFISLINSNDPKKIRAYVQQSFTDEFFKMVPMDVHLTAISTIYNNTRGVEFYSKREFEGKTPPGENTIIVHSKTTGQWSALVFQLEPVPPHRFTNLFFTEARPPHEVPKLQNLSQKEIVSNFKKLVTKLGKADVFSGTVLLAKDGKILFKKAFGEASKRFHVPNKIDTKFNLGSMNKMFTSVAILQLVEKGKLSLDDPLSKFVSDDWMPKSLSDKIKIKHLLTHTSGLGSYFNEAFMNSSRLLFRELDDYKKLIEVKELPFEPGDKFQYSNVGMFMLGVVIEKVTGQRYFDYVKEHIHEPAGMKNTDCYEMDRPVPNLAIGYSRVGSEWRNNLYDHVVKGAAAGGGFSTVEDLLAFDIAIRNNKLLSAEMTKTMLNEKPELNCPEYGYGFMVQRKPTDRIVGHGGGFTGIRASLDMFMDSGYTSIVLSNYDFGVFPIIFKAQELIAARKK